MGEGRHLVAKCTKQKLYEGWAHNSEASVGKANPFCKEIHRAGDVALDRLSMLKASPPVQWEKGL